MSISDCVFKTGFATNVVVVVVVGVVVDANDEAVVGIGGPASLIFEIWKKSDKTFFCHDAPDKYQVFVPGKPFNVICDVRTLLLD